MADPLEIPIPLDTPLYEIRVELDGTSYTLRFDYSGKEDRWYLSIRLLDGAPVRRGLKVVAGWNVLRLCHTANRSPGVLFFSDPRSPIAPSPGFPDLGRDVRAFYFPAP